MLDQDLHFQLELSAATAVTDGDRVNDGNRGRVFRKESLKAGTFYKNGQEFTISREDLIHFGKSVDVQLEKGIRIDLPSEHTGDPDKSRGKVIGQEVVDDSLFLFVEFANDEYAKLADTAEVSVFVPPSYEVGTTGEVLHRPLRHLALTQDPVVNDLQPFEMVLSRKPQMKMSELAKSVGVSVEDGADDTVIGKAIAAAFKAKKAVKPEVKKKPEEETKLSHDPVTAQLLKENRQGKIQALVASRKITPAIQKQLEDAWTTDEQITLSLSNPATMEAFNSVIQSLDANQPIATGDGSSTSQAQVLQLSKDDVVDAEKNPLLAACKS